MILNILNRDDGEMELTISNNKIKYLTTPNKNIGAVLQDSSGSLNPRMKIQQILLEPLEILGFSDKNEMESKTIRAINEIGLDESEAKIISSSKTMANMFEEASSKTEDAKLVAKWLVGDISALLNKDNIDIDESNLSADNFGIIIERISDGTISGKIAKSVLEEVWETGSDVDEIIQSKGLVQIQDESILEDIAKKVIEYNPDQVLAYKAGKDKLFGFFVGQIMKETQGKANPKAVNEILKDLLK